MLTCSPRPGNKGLEASLTVALGSNNYLLARSETGGERATAMSSPIRTAELNGLDPQG